MTVHNTWSYWLEERTGLSVIAATATVLLLAAAGVAVGIFLPKFEATALLQFPEPRKLPEERKTSEELSAADKAAFERGNTVELAPFKRVAASYGSTDQLRAYIEAVSQQQSPAAQRLLTESERGAFWDKVATPILPFNRRDQRVFGDIKDAAATTLLGLDLSTDARTESVAIDMIRLLAGFYTNAVMRERIRSWVLAGKVESLGTDQTLRAEIVRAELDIELLSQRAKDMKSILARYPDAAKMETRQLVAVTPNDGGERFLSPLAQLVGLESAISQRRETIRRRDRELRQKELTGAFFKAAEQLVDATTTVDQLMPHLRELAMKLFAAADGSQEWVQESTFRIGAALDGFAVMQSQFGVRNGIRVGRVAGRDPLRLGLLGAAAGLALLFALAFARASLRSREEVTPEPSQRDIQAAS